MEFGGAKVQLALKIKYSLKEAFELRLSGNYEQAADKIEYAFLQFAGGNGKESERVPRSGAVPKYSAGETGRDRQRDNFKGHVTKTASGLSLLPLIDLVMAFDGKSLKKALQDQGKTLCQKLMEHLDSPHGLRAGVIVRPGQELNIKELVAKLQEEDDNGALGLTCYLLVQNCKASNTATNLRLSAMERDMHATALQWEPDSGRENWQPPFRQRYYRSAISR